MLTRLFIRSDLVKGCSVSYAHVGPFLSQAIASYKPTVTRALHLARNVQIFTAPKTQLYNLRTGACKRNGRIFEEGSSRDLSTIGQSQTSTLNINTEVINNVYLFKYDRPRFFKILTASSYVQIVFWLGVAFALSLQVAKFDADTNSWKEYLVDNCILITAIIMSSVAGIGGCLLLWFFAARSVRFLVLNKGGKSVTVVTYHPFNKTVTTVPLDCVECKRNRKDKSAYVPMKMAGRRFFYILDKNGEFVNPTLFDYTVGALKT